MRTFLAGTMIVALIISTTPCHANLGDTLAKCEARYGPALPGRDTPDPSGVGDVILAFQSRGYHIRTILVRGYVGGESFVKADNTPLSEAEKALLLKNEANGWAWARSTSTVGENWLRTDGAVATYAPQFHAMIIETGTYVEAVKTKQSAQKSQ